MCLIPHPNFFKKRITNHIPKCITYWIEIYCLVHCIYLTQNLLQSSNFPVSSLHFVTSTIIGFIYIHTYMHTHTSLMSSFNVASMYRYLGSSTWITIKGLTLLKTHYFFQHPLISLSFFFIKEWGNMSIPYPRWHLDWYGYYTGLFI